MDGWSEAQNSHVATANPGGGRRAQSHRASSATVRGSMVSPRDGDPNAPPPVRIRRKKHWGRRILVLLLLIVLTPLGYGMYLDIHLKRTDALADYAGRVADTPGTNWLLIGSDSRAGLSDAEAKTLNTGSGDLGSRTDSIMLLHIPTSGNSTLVSIPRDSLLPIPGHGTDKINSAFSLGGAELLVRTIEESAHLRIDHYAEIGFGGFAKMVDAVGGVHLCLDQPMDDEDSGAHLAAGCQDLNGRQALGFVRNRHQFTNQDLTRVANQRKFLSALLAKVSSSDTLTDPFKAFPLLTKAIDSFTVDRSDHLWNLAKMGQSMRGLTLTTTTVPVVLVNGDLHWDPIKSPRFWGALAADQQVPPELLTAAS